MTILNLTSEFRAVALLGGASLAWVAAIRKGLPTRALDSLGQNINATNTELAQILGISARALERRRHNGILSSYDSERLIRAASVIVRAEDVFDDFDKALTWLKEPKLSLGGEAPISLLDTDIGTELVADVLGTVYEQVKRLLPFLGLMQSFP